MKTTARRDGGDWVLNGTKHFISHADVADFAIVFVATGEEETRARHARSGSPASSSTRARRASRSATATATSRTAATTTASSNSTIAGCRTRQILGEERKGFEVDEHLARRHAAAGRRHLRRPGRRALDLAVEWAASRKQFGQPIGKFQGVSFKLADMATEIEAADLLTLEGAWQFDQGTDANRRWPWPS